MATTHRPEMVYCWKCKREISGTALNCMFCGTEQSLNAHQDSQRPNPGPPTLQADDFPSPTINPMSLHGELEDQYEKLTDVNSLFVLFQALCFTLSATIGSPSFLCFLVATIAVAITRSDKYRVRRHMASLQVNDDGFLQARDKRLLTASIVAWVFAVIVGCAVKFVFTMEAASHYSHV